MFIHSYYVPQFHSNIHISKDIVSIFPANDRPST